MNPVSGVVRMPPVAQLVVAVLAQCIVGGPRKTNCSSQRLATSGMMAGLSGGLLVASVVQFRRRHTTVNPVDPTAVSSFVTTGANRVSRNPMYVGMAGLLLSHTVLRGSWAAAVPAVLFVLSIDRLQIPAEESALGARFGADFDRYRAQVPRWLDRRSVAFPFSV